MTDKVRSIIITIVLPVVSILSFITVVRLLPSSCQDKIIGREQTVKPLLPGWWGWWNNPIIHAIINNSDHKVDIKEIEKEVIPDYIKDIARRYNHLLNTPPKITIDPQLIEVNEYGAIDLTDSRDLVIFWEDPIKIGTTLLRIDANIIPSLTAISKPRRLGIYASCGAILRKTHPDKPKFGLYIGFDLDYRIADRVYIETTISTAALYNSTLDITATAGLKFKIY